ncbi:hypothetical protein BDV12DRAFT_177276 [Aspergillus spectabilis]
MKLTLLSLIVRLFSQFFTATTTSITIVPPTPVPQDSNVQWISNSTGFDGPKVKPINDTTWDWWYFDAIQVSEDPDEQASVMATFYTATPNGFDSLIAYHNAGFTSLTLAEVNIVWPNGTHETYIFNATEAVITTVGDGASGVFEEGIHEASFTGSPNMSTYRVDLQSPWVSGSLTLQSIAPPHYPCGPAVAGQSLEIMPHVGWANAIPDAVSTVELTVGGHPLTFTGIGYHDKNFGEQNFGSNVGSWYWGHGRLGEYSVVWFDGLTPERQNFVSAYVARNNEILIAQCSGVTVRPYGEDATYPPLISTEPPSGFVVNFTLPDRDLDLTAAGKHVIAGGRAGLRYTRWSGTLEGVIDGELLTGDTMFEQFNFFTE